MIGADDEYTPEQQLRAMVAQLEQRLREAQARWEDLEIKRASCCVANEERAERAERRVEELEGALRALALEATGFVSMADPAAHGHTNIAVLRHKIDNAQAALARPAPTEGGGE